MIEKIRVNRHLPYVMIISFLIFFSMWLTFSFSMYNFKMNFSGFSPVFYVSFIIEPCILIFFICMFFSVLNRLSCVITIDYKNKTISRKGFFCGYKAFVKFQDITEIKTEYAYKGGSYYVIYDKDHKVFTSPNSKNCPIWLPKTEKNYAVIEKIEAELKIIREFEGEEY